MELTFCIFRWVKSFLFTIVNVFVYYAVCMARHMDVRLMCYSLCFKQSIFQQISIVFIQLHNNVALVCLYKVLLPVIILDFLPDFVNCKWRKNT